MKPLILILLCFPALLCAQEFQFRQEFDTIPVEIDGWRPYVPWLGGIGGVNSIPELCDINADGDLDLFCGDGNTSLIYFENIGTVLMADFHFNTYQFEPFNPAPYLCFADMDNDDDLDALYGYRCFYNLGSPTQFVFQSPGDSLFDTNGNLLICPRMAVVDIDSDDDFDIFAGQMYSGEVRFYENVGSPEQAVFQLTAEAWLGIAVSGGCADPTFVDIDADGDLDLFIGNEAGNIYFYRNDGTPQQYNFTFVTDNYNNIDVGEYASPEFADIDGDGDYDLLVGRDQYSTSISPGDVYFYRNLGTPQVAQWEFVTKNYLSLDEGYTIESSAMTDIDADSDFDLFNQNTGDHISYYLNTGTSLSAMFTWQTYSYQNISVNDAGLEFCDVDGDGDMDLFLGEAAIPGPPHLWLFQNIGSPQVANYSLFSNNLLPGVFTQNTVAIRPGVADINNDGDYDLFLGDIDHHFYYFQNSGSPSHFNFTMNSLNWQGVLPDTVPAILLYPTFYDIDNDGDLDLFLGTLWNWNQLWFFRNVGTPQVPEMVLETPTFLGDTSLIQHVSVEIVDIDHDGDGDFFCSTYEGGITFHRNITGDSTAVLQPTKMRPRPSRATLTIGPNPSNPVTAISYQLSAVSFVNLSVYDISGRRVAQLVNGRQNPGDYSVSWNATGNASGVYLVRLTTPVEEIAQKVVVVK